MSDGADVESSRREILTFFGGTTSLLVGSSPVSGLSAQWSHFSNKARSSEGIWASGRKERVASERIASGEDWSQVARLTANDTRSTVRFGQSVALAENGTTALVGDLFGENPDGDYVGSTYLFSNSGGEWTQQSELVADDTNNEDFFGVSVALSEDGTTALVGASRDEDPNGDYAGSAYVFSKGGGEWTQQAKLAADDGSRYARFGRSVALSRDGKTALIGSDGDQNATGSAYLFSFDSDGWTQEAKLTANDGDSYDRFGESVALSADGTTALIGAWHDGQSRYQVGSSYVFSADDGYWTQEAKLTADDGDEEDHFGKSVALSEDGTTALVGVVEQPADVEPASSYVFSGDSGEWTQQAKLSADENDGNELFGFSVALSGDGTTAFVGVLENENQVSSAYVFSAEGGEWTQQATPTVENSEVENRFGWSAALSRDGTTGIIGAWQDQDSGSDNAGAAYVFADESGGRSGENSDQFVPQRNGFGFRNYSTGDGPDLGEIQNIVSEAYIAELDRMGLNTSLPGFSTAVATGLYTALDGGLTDGHCLGMVHTARQYYNSGTPSLPDYSKSVDTAADITDPPESSDGLDPVEHDIDEVQHTQALDPQFGLRYMTEAFAPNEGAGAIDHRAVLSAIEERVSSGDTASLSLVESSVGLIGRLLGGHQVLAYDIEPEQETISESGTVEVHVYDPNYRAQDYQDENRQSMLRFNRASTTRDFSLAYVGPGEFDRAIYLDEAPSPDLQFFQDTEDAQGFAAALSEGLSNYIAIGVKSPVVLEVIGSEDEPIPRIPIPQETLREESEFEQIYLGFGTDSGTYDIEASGTGSGEYEIVVRGSQSEGGIIDETYEGTIEEDETHSFSATVPENNSESGSLTRNDGERQEGTQTTTTSRETSEPSRDPTKTDAVISTGDGDGAGGMPSWLPIAGGAGGLGIAGLGAYWYKQNTDSNDDS